MREPLIYVVAIITAMVFVAGCVQNSVTFDEDEELVVEAGDFDVYFELVEPFSEAYMLFGGDPMTHAGAIGDFWLAAISMEDARPIYEEYPDFYMCASPGATRAKKVVKTMNIVAADSDVLAELNGAISEHEDSLGQGGDRVAVILDGVKLEMTAAMVREAQEDIMDRLPGQARSNYFLVESVELVEAQAELEGY